MINLIWTTIFSYLSGLMYRWGGSEKKGKWYDFIYNTKTRDAGVPSCMIVLMTVTGNWHWTLILCFGLLFGACTTYNKWVGYFFNRPDKSTVYWESWLVTGIFYGLAMLPYAIATGCWLGFWTRVLLVGAFTCLWSEKIDSDVWEERGRGFVIVSTIPLLF